MALVLGAARVMGARHPYHAARTKNLRAVQLLLGDAKLESAVRYLGIDVDDELRDHRSDCSVRRRSDRRLPAS
jgi:hypothetical protein